MRSQKKKTNWKLIIIAGVIIWLIFTLLGSISRGNVENGTQPKTVLSPEERREAMQPCINSGGTEQACGCMIDKLTERYTLSELTRMNLEQKINGKSDTAMEIAKECYNEINAQST